MSDSTGRPRSRKATRDRPGKPYPDCPFTTHPSGAWQKKIRGCIHYFGKWARRVNGRLERVPAALRAAPAARPEPATEEGSRPKTIRPAGHG